MDAVQSWWKWLCDFSAGKEEDRRVAHALIGILQVALAESKTDAGFEQCFRLLVKASSGLKEEHLWSWLNHRLSGYRRAGEFAAMLRVLVQRFLRNIPRRYGMKETKF